MSATTLFLPLEGGGDSRAARRVGVVPCAGWGPPPPGPATPSLASPLKGEERL